MEKPLAIKENMYNDVMDIPALWEPKEFRLKCQVQLGFLRSFCLGVVSFFDVCSISLSFNQISIGTLGAFRHLLFATFFQERIPLLDFCKENGILVQAYGSMFFGASADLASKPLKIL